jgi:hypothetical protein
LNFSSVAFSIPARINSERRYALDGVPSEHRDPLRDVVLELAYNPVMSEYGDIGYLPTYTAEGSCYVTLGQCHLAIIIVGRRYGSISENGLSVTHNEFRTARSQGIPIVSLVDSEVIAYKKIFDTNNTGEGFSTLGMDAPPKTFGFIEEIATSPRNNGMLLYTTVAEARRHLKRQFAHFFGELLTGHFDPIEADVKDVLSEIKTLRHEIVRDGVVSDNRFLKAVRFLIDDTDDASQYRGLLKAILRTPIDSAVPMLTASDSFDAVALKITGQPLEVVPIDDPLSFSDATPIMKARGIASWSMAASGIAGSPIILTGIKVDGTLVINAAGLERFRSIHHKFLDFLNQPA